MRAYTPNYKNIITVNITVGARSRKNNDGYSRHGFYRSGPMPYWPKKKRIMNKERDVKPEVRIKYKYSLTPDQILLFIRYLDKIGNFRVEISPRKANRILNVNIPDSLWLDEDWWSTIFNSPHWKSKWTLSKMSNKGTIVFEELLEL
jgi:hypothetical protein